MSWTATLVVVLTAVSATPAAELNETLEGLTREGGALWRGCAHVAYAELEREVSALQTAARFRQMHKRLEARYSHALKAAHDAAGDAGRIWLRQSAASMMARTWMCRAIVELAARNRGGAEEAFERALSLDPAVGEQPLRPPRGVVARLGTLSALFDAHQRAVDRAAPLRVWIRIADEGASAVLRGLTLEAPRNGTLHTADELQRWTERANEVLRRAAEVPASANRPAIELALLPGHWHIVDAAGESLANFELADASAPVVYSVSGEPQAPKLARLDVSVGGSAGGVRAASVMEQPIGLTLTAPPSPGRRRAGTALLWGGGAGLLSAALLAGVGLEAHQRRDGAVPAQRHELGNRRRQMFLSAAIVGGLSAALIVGGALLRELPVEVDR